MQSQVGRSRCRINRIAKREEVLDILNRKSELLALAERKLKGNGEVLWCGVNGIIASEIEKSREVLAVHFNDVWHSVVIEFECVRIRILRVKFKFSRVKVCMVVGYGPTEGIGEGRERF